MTEFNFNEVDKVLMIDPPSGWRYGFPKKAPTQEIRSNQVLLNEWLIDNGYPKRLIDVGWDKYCRYWYEEKDNTNAEE